MADGPDDPDGHAPSGAVPHEPDGSRSSGPSRAGRLEHLGREGLESGVDALGWAARSLTPAWQRATEMESRGPASVAIGVAIVLRLALPLEFTINPWWAIPAIEVPLLIGLLLANPRQVDGRSAWLRNGSLVLIGVLTATNTWSAFKLIRGLLHGGNYDATRLLATGGAIWLTNTIAFALWYWEFDRGGPGRRSAGTSKFPDFLFPQMASPELAPPDWKPLFVDYFYLSFTNATAFSPTDVMPMSRWTKMMMMLQSSVSLVTIALVIARAVNIFRG